MVGEDFVLGRGEEEVTSSLVDDVLVVWCEVDGCGELVLAETSNNDSLIWQAWVGTLAEHEDRPLVLDCHCKLLELLWSVGLAHAGVQEAPLSIESALHH